MLTATQVERLEDGVAVYTYTAGKEWWWQRIPHWPHNFILCGDPHGPYSTEIGAFQAAPKEE